MPTSMDVSPGTSLEYDLVDVFADEPFAGNALAVVHGSQGLSAAAMQAMATEFHLSETAFPVVRGPAGADAYDVRIFTTQTELPFAGHPSVGSAWCLARRGLVQGPDLVQHCGAGPVQVTVGAGPDDLTWLTGAAATLRPEQDPAGPLLAVGLTEADLVGLPTVVAGTGLGFCYLFVRPGSVARAAPDLRLLRQLRPLGPDLGGVAVIGWHDGTARARVFTDDIGAAEDPATGSAALGLAVVLVAQGLLPADGESRFTVSQGIEMGRPSLLHCRVLARGGRAVDCRVGGRVVHVASGTMVAPRR